MIQISVFPVSWFFLAPGVALVFQLADPDVRQEKQVHSGSRFLSHLIVWSRVDAVLERPRLLQSVQGVPIFATSAKLKVR